MHSRGGSAPFGAGQGPTPYDKVSFVRSRKPPRIVTMEASPERVELDLATTALLVTDMQNDFLHPEGWVASRGVDVSRVRAPIPAIERCTSAARSAGVPVIWVNCGVRPDHASVAESFVERAARGAHGPTYGDRSPSGRGRIFVRGDWGAETIDELTVARSDLLVYKHRLSGFRDNELDSILRARGITTLLFSGISTDRCVFTSLQDANVLGYDCLLVEDACGTTSPDFVRDAVLHIIRLAHGMVTTSEAFCAAAGVPELAEVRKAG